MFDAFTKKTRNVNRQTVLSFALHEMRTLRRLLRTHIFIWVALAISTVYFVAVTLNHMHGASEIPALGVISPRYILSLLGANFIGSFCVGVLLLTFDQVNRDETCRIHEVVSSKPASTVEQSIGRLLGVSMTMAIPMLIFLFAILSYGVVSEIFSFRFGEPVELWSVISFIVLDIVPNFLFFGSLLVLLSSLFKSRLLALLLTVGCLFGLFWLTNQLPLDVSKPLHTVTGNVIFPSEITPTMYTPFIAFNRVALVLMSFGFLFWVSYFGSRVSPSKTKDLLWGSLSFGIGLIVIGAMFGVKTLERNRIEHWVNTHDQNYVPDSFPDVKEIRGSVDVKPGKLLSIDLTLTVSVDTNQDGDWVLFSLNPAYKISRLTVAGAEITDHNFQQGLLKIPLRYFNSDITELELTAKGRPDGRFAYLDSIDELSQISGTDAQQLRQLGTDNFIFRSDFVALLPAIKWYPTSGTATNEDDWEHRKKDFFTLDVQVSVPRSWTVAGPAERKLETSEERNRTEYLFQQTNAIADFALVGSKFESASFEIEGITFEILYSKAHQSTFKQLAPLTSVLKNRLQWELNSLKDRGFVYPYGSFTLVEVPSTLRVFGSGINIDTVMCPPGMIMIRESTLPTYPVDSILTDRERDSLREPDIDEANAHYWGVQNLLNYLNNFTYESNANFGFYGSLLRQQTSATQRGAHALNMLIEHLYGHLFPYTNANFDLQLALDRKVLNLARVDPLDIFRTHSSRRRYTDLYEDIYRLQHRVMFAPTVWKSAEALSLYTPVANNDHTLFLRGMRLRTQQLVQYVIDTIGRESTESLVMDITKRFRGQNFEMKDFVEVFAAHGFDLPERSGDLFSDGDLPGFFVSSPSTRLVEDDGPFRYETTFELRNGERISGPVQLAVSYQNDRFGMSDAYGVPVTTLLVEANQSLRVEVGSNNPVQYVWVKPYLSLNRMNLRLELPVSEEWREQEFLFDDPPLIKSIEEVNHSTTEYFSITIDDLDPGFSILDFRSPALLDRFGGFLRDFLGKEEIPLDNGLPKYQVSNRPSELTWYRWTDPTAFGVYRRTFAIAPAGDGLVKAQFSTTLPNQGEWELEYFLPKGHFGEETVHARGSGYRWSAHALAPIHIEVQIGSALTTHNLDAPNGVSSWKSVGKFDITDTNVDVRVSNETDSRGWWFVLADAIRWTPTEVEDEE